MRKEQGERVMPRRVTTVLLVGIAVEVVMGLFPPWVFPSNWSGPNAWRYGFLFDPPPLAVDPDMTRLVTQWLVVAFATAGAALWAYHAKHPRD
jgi:hypothetical protein